MRKHTLLRDRRRGDEFFVRIMRNKVSRYFPLRTTNRKVAQKRLQNLEGELAAGKIQFIEQETSQVVREDGSKDIRVEELAVKHLEWVKSNLSDGTFAVRQNYVSQFVAFVGESMVSEITRAKLEAFHSWAKTTNGRGPNGGNEALANVKTMLLWGLEMELCSLSFRKFPKLVRTPSETKRLPEGDLVKLLAVAGRDHDLRDLLQFGLLTGLRPKELIGLRRSNFLTDGGGAPYLSIQHHKTSRTARTPRPRTVPLCPDAHAILERQLDAHPASELVFLNGWGTPYKRDGFKTRLKRLCKRAKTSRGFSPYSLRHTFASMESDAGVETTGLARLMGHSTTRTLERYVVNTFDSHRKAVVALQDRINAVTRQKPDEGNMAPGFDANLTPTVPEAKRTCDGKVASPSISTT